MKVLEIITEEYKVVQTDLGFKSGWKVIDTTTGQQVGKIHRVKGLADAEARAANKSASGGKMPTADVDDVDKTNKTPDTDTDDDNDKDKDKSKKGWGKKILAFFGQTAIGQTFFLLFSANDLVNDLDRFGDAYEASGCNPNDRYVIAAQVKLVDNLVANISGFLLATAGTWASVAAFARLLAAFPGFGWAASLLGGFTGGALAYLAGQLAKNTDFLKGIANALMNSMLNPAVLKQISFANCNLGESENEMPKKLPVKKHADRAKKNILSDPKLKKLAMQALKKSKAKAS